MKFQKLAIAALGAVTLTAATLTLTLKSNAQGGEPPQGGQAFPGAGPRGLQGGPQPGQGFPGQPGQGQFRPNFGGGMGGGGTAMDSDNSFLYILQGNMLFKVAKADLKIVGGTPLMPQMPDQMMMRPGARQGGGQSGPPPPPSPSK